MGATVTLLPTAVKTDDVLELLVQDKRELHALLAFLGKLRDDVHFQDRLISCVADHEVEGLDGAIRALIVFADMKIADNPHGYVAALVKLYHALANVVDTSHEADGTQPEQYAVKGAAIPSGRLMLTLRSQYDSQAAASAASIADAGHTALVAAIRQD